MMYDSLDHYIRIVSDNLKSAQQVHRRELKKKDEVIQDLTDRLESLQFREREFEECIRFVEKEKRELMSSNQSLKHQISNEQMENVRLKEEMSEMRQTLESQDDEIAYLKQEKEKADHIIKKYFSPMVLKKPHPIHTKQPILHPKTV